MSEKAVSILGCGWLGFPLAERLIEMGYTVKGSTTSPDKVPDLQRAGIRPFCLKAQPQVSGNGIQSFFESDILFLNIPFRRNLADPDFYRQQVQSVAELVERSPVDFVVFASSTSVYPSSLADASEDAPFEADNGRAEALLAAERLLMRNRKFDATIVRFAGLYGGGRQIGRLLAGRSGVPEAGAPVNLIHLEDCLRIAAQIIREHIKGEIFNACSDGHPTRKELYTAAAEKQGFKAPLFADAPHTRSKIVNNSKLKSRLNYAFRHPDPLVF